MRKSSSARAGLFLGAAVALVGASAGGALAADDLKAVLQRQTQEMMDAVAAGNAAVWDRYLDPGLRYTDESGNVSTKKELVGQLKPLPKNVSGVIRVTNFDVTRHGNVAVATHVEDEHETYHGQKLHCQYRTTDTWIETKDGWRLIATQVLALRTDPPSVKLPAARRSEYCGKYALAELAYEVRCEGEKLMAQRTGRKPEELKAEAPDVLFVPGQPRYRWIFRRDAAGKITGFAERREAWDLEWKRQ